jgi:hypothetical protein
MRRERLSELPDSKKSAVNPKGEEVASKLLRSERVKNALSELNHTIQKVTSAGFSRSHVDEIVGASIKFAIAMEVSRNSVITNSNPDDDDALPTAMRALRMGESYRQRTKAGGKKSATVRGDANRSRDERILRLSSQGIAAEDIASKFNLTSSRVRQILKKMN